MIKTEGLTKVFDTYTALDNVSCTIPNGCICGIVGSNGAGKSTLLRLITGIYKPDKGSVSIDDLVPFDNPDIKCNIAYVPDDLYFTPGATIKKMSTLYKSVYKNFDDARCKELVEAFKLDMNRPITTFSKGMKRQAATLLALSTKAEYLLFDETFDGFDPIVRNYVKSIICEDVMERKSTAIITSHSLRELEDICDKLALLHKGGLILQNDVENLKTSHFKAQLAFTFDYDESLFGDLEYKRFTKCGSVCSMIIKGNEEETKNFFNKLNPVICDILPLTLEEIFAYEMETLEYSFDISLTGMED
ncbi:MAG: ABC transporter ATP-binding protein [Lachnospiraceae bacterium]|nr:ABC transporter ATP-binding protein [Lachnospiraceae bacterium]